MRGGRPPNRMTWCVPPLPRPRTVADAIEAAGQALRGRKLHEAERLARYVLKTNAANVEAARILGHSLLQQGRFAEAASVLQKPARRSKSAELEALRARTLAKAGRTADAISLEVAITRGRRFRSPSCNWRSCSTMMRRSLAPRACSTRVSRCARAIRSCSWDSATIICAGATALRPAACSPRCREPARSGETHSSRSPARCRWMASIWRPRSSTRGLFLKEPWDGVSRIALAKCPHEAGRREAGAAQLRAVVRGEPRLWGLVAPA